VREGCRDPLVVWPGKDGKRVLLGGHNRFEICGSVCPREEVLFWPNYTLTQISRGFSVPP
jgi:hypothetical protein